MNRTFFASTPGRLTLTATGMGMAAMGAFSFAGPDQDLHFWTAVVPLLTIIVGMFAVATAILEAQSEQIIVMIFGLPILAFLGYGAMVSSIGAGVLPGAMYLGTATGMFAYAAPNWSSFAATVQQQRPAYSQR